MISGVEYGPGYVARGEAAARACRALRDEYDAYRCADHRGTYSQAKAERIWIRYQEARRLMRAYGWGLDDEAQFAAHRLGVSA